jgi:hypothetical protein
VELALEAGVPTKTHVLNLLHRLLDGKPTDQPDVSPPAGLSLSARTGVIRSRIPITSGHSFRFDPVTDSGVSDHLWNRP